MSEGTKLIAVLLLVIGIIAAFFAVMSAQAQACEDKGGHMVRIYKSQICVTEDGRIIE